MNRWVVVLAGGVGARFWPLSTPSRPKQFLPLVSEHPLLTDTVRRLAPLADLPHTLVLTSASLAEGVRTLLPGMPPANVIAEPRPAGTAAALAWAAAEIARRDGPDALMLSVHADWAISNADGFRAALQLAATTATTHRALVTVGVVPTRPDPGLGYIRPGDTVDAHARRVAEFVEKPTRERATIMIGEGCLWNSGIFVWCVGDFLNEIRAHTPEVAPALASAKGDLEAFFRDVRNVSVDVGVMERSTRVLVLRGDFGWDDVGTWAALRRVRAIDPQGNATQGAVHAMDSHGNVVHAAAGDVVLFGVDNLVVVTRDGLTFVTTVDRAVDLKVLLDALPPQVRDRS